MPRRTNPFQQLTASITASFQGLNYEVRESVLNVNKITGAIRELDIVITNSLDNSDKTLVECRDHKRKQDVQWIDSLEGKARRLGFKKTVAVSSSGFTKPAIKEAEERGIKTLHIREAEAFNWGNKADVIMDRLTVTIDHEPRIEEITLVPKAKESIQYSLGECKEKSVYLVNNVKGVKMSLCDYALGFMKKPEVVSYIRTHNAENKLTKHKIPTSCSSGVGYLDQDHNFIELDKIIFLVESLQEKHKPKIKYLKIGEEKIVIGEIEGNKDEMRLVFRNQDGFLDVMVEQKIRK